MIAVPPHIPFLPYPLTSPPHLILLIDVSLYLLITLYFISYSFEDALLPHGPLLATQLLVIQIETYVSKA